MTKSKDDNKKRILELIEKIDSMAPEKKSALMKELIELLKKVSDAEREYLKDLKKIRTEIEAKAKKKEE